MWFHNHWNFLWDNGLIPSKVLKVVLFNKMLIEFGLYLYFCRGQKCGSISTLSKSHRVWGCSKLLTSVVTHPDLGCGYFVFRTLGWPVQVDFLYFSTLNKGLRIKAHFCSFFVIKGFGLGSELRIPGLG